MHGWQFVILAVVALAALAIIAYLGGPVLLGTRERPDRLVGSRVRLGHFEVRDPARPESAPGIIRRYEEPYYLVEFDVPPILAGHRERHAWISSRHRGWAVSGARRWGTVAVQGKFESGEQFIALVVRA